MIAFSERDLTVEMVREVREQLKSQAIALRKEEYRTLLDFYEGGRAPLSEEYAKRHYREEEEAWLARRVNLRGLNITRAIPERIRDALYGRKVERTCAVPEQDAILRGIYAQNHFDTVAGQIALEASILGSHIVGPYYDERLGRVAFRTRYLGDVYPWVSEQNADALEALLVEVAIDDLFSGESFLRAEIYTPWETGVFLAADSRSSYWELDRSFHPDGDLTNRYGVIPWVHFRGRSPAQSGDWFGLSDIRDVVEVNKFVNELLSIADKNAHDQGWSQLVLINFPDDVEKVSVGTSKAIRTGEGGDAKYIVPDLKIGEFLELIDRLYRWAHESAMVPLAAVRTSDQARSGVALQIELKPLLDLVAEREKRYRRNEIELMKLTLLVDAAHREGRTFTPEEAREFLASVECDCVFKGGVVPEDPAAELERDLKMLAAGLADPVDLVARYHGISRADAEKKLNEIRGRREE
jgi:hypothetical protein